MNEIIINNKIESVLIQGDLSSLNAEERLNYYKKVCDSLGLNPLTKPFEYIVLNGKLTLYARKDCTEQLRKIYGVSILDIETTFAGDLYIVKVKARDKSGKRDVASGVVQVSNLAGEKLANALMKCETKAKRRVTLSICGLAFLDESEIENVYDKMTVAENEIFEKKLEIANQNNEIDLKEEKELAEFAGSFNLRKSIEDAYLNKKAFVYDLSKVLQDKKKEVFQIIIDNKMVLKSAEKLALSLEPVDELEYLLIFVPEL